VRTGFPSAQVLELEHDIGSSARDLGVRLAATPYVAFGDDSWWAPGALAEAVFDRHPRLCCASVVRREAYLAAGGIDPVLFFIGEEKLLAWDLAAGWGPATSTRWPPTTTRPRNGVVPANGGCWTCATTC
jgi:hypothetical protein